jgi:hypothetical protein
LHRTVEPEPGAELYAFASPQYNAMCFKPEDGRLFIMFASSLLEAFDEGELKFVLGHELGHHAYRHHDAPIGYILRGASRPDPRFALSLFTWSRYAEISADRAGAHCAQDLEVVARALFKLASGLSGSTIEFHLADFLNQADDMQVLDQEPGTGDADHARPLPGRPRRKLHHWGRVPVPATNRQGSRGCGQRGRSDFLCSNSSRIDRAPRPIDGWRARTGTGEFVGAC